MTAPVAQWIEFRSSEPAVLGSNPSGRFMRLFDGGVEKWSSRQAHNLKNAGSNPASTISALALTGGGYSLMVKCWLVAPRDMGSTPVNPVT